MMIIDPVALGDVTCTRASPKWVFDRTGIMVQVPPHTLAVTYDPNDLTKAPYALAEPAAVKCLPKNDALTSWLTYAPTGATVSVQTVIDPRFGTVFRITKTGGNPGDRAGIRLAEVAGLSGSTYSAGCYIRRGTSSTTGCAPYVDANTNAGSILTCSVPVSDAQDVGVWTWVSRSIADPARTLTGTGTAYIWIDSNVGDYFDVKLPEVELGSSVSSPSVVGAGLAPYTRAADVLSAGAGLVYSNVPITEAPYNVGMTYAKDAVVYDPATYLTYKSVVDANSGNPLSDTTKWTKGDVINQRKMLDQYNNTQTGNSDEILLVVSPQTICRGFYLGNMDANEVRVSVTDLNDGVVYSEVQNLVVSTSGSSFYKWCFSRIRRKTYAVSVLLPVYANALITILIRKLGGTPKCGMCAIGPVVDIGLSEWGISTEIKDYSTTTFQFDGTSDTVLRGYSRRMSLDVEIDNDQKDAVEDMLAMYRQKPVAWLGTVLWGSACLFGRYSSFKSVLANLKKSKMSLQIEGTVQ